MPQEKPFETKKRHRQARGGHGAGKLSYAGDKPSALEGVAEKVAGMKLIKESSDLKEKRGPPPSKGK